MSNNHLNEQIRIRQMEIKELKESLSRKVEMEKSLKYLSEMTNAELCDQRDELDRRVKYLYEKFKAAEEAYQHSLSVLSILEAHMGM